jgi:hypothetical protein
MKNEAIAIFDNGGGITLQLGAFAHHYSDPELAAANWQDYANNPDPSDWEGHEPEALEIDPTYDQISNGGYRVFASEEIEAEVGKDQEDQSWNNVRSFIVALQGKSKA